MTSLGNLYRAIDPDELALQALLHAFGDSERSASNAALAAIARIGFSRADIRHHALRANAVRTRTLTALIRALGDPEDANVRNAAASMAGHLQFPETHKALKRASHDPDEEVVLSAKRSLQQIRRKRAAEPLPVTVIDSPWEASACN